MGIMLIRRRILLMERLVLERGWIGFTIVCKLDIDFSVVVVRRQPCGNIRILLNKAGKYWFHLIKRFCCIHIYLYHTNLTKNDQLCQLQYFTLFILFVYFFLFVYILKSRVHTGSNSCIWNQQLVASDHSRLWLPRLCSVLITRL